MITYDKYKSDRETHLKEMENVPDTEIDFILELLHIDITKSLPQIRTGTYSANRTPFIKDQLALCSEKSFRKIHEKCKELGWSVKIILKLSGQSNINFEAKINKLKT